MDRQIGRQKRVRPQDLPIKEEAQKETSHQSEKETNYQWSTINS